MKKCGYCKEKKDDSEFYVRTDGSNRLSCYCKTCNTIKKREVTRDIKKRAVEYKGGKCSICGYNKCFNALEFHHLNPKEKDFGFGKVKSTKFETLKKELDKCILVCSNCHREIHDETLHL